LTLALEEGEGSGLRPCSTLHPGKTRYPIYRRLGGPQGRSGQVRKISGFDPRTIQPVGRFLCHRSRYNFMQPGGREAYEATNS